jgi:hypothetical protein
MVTLVKLLNGGYTNIEFFSSKESWKLRRAILGVKGEKR